eukprot:1963635-Pleurochrysis_carterae.AAC.2
MATAASASSGTYEERWQEHFTHLAHLPASPDGLQLQQTHVFFRHGEKYPSIAQAAYFPAYPLEPKLLRREKSSLPGLRDSGSRPNEAELPALKADQDGELSVAGRQRMYHLGAQLRKALIEQVALLQADVPNTKELRLWSQNGPRSPGDTEQRHFESLREVMFGLWPDAADADADADGFLTPCVKGVDVKIGVQYIGVGKWNPVEQDLLRVLGSAWAAFHRAEDETVAATAGVAPLVAAATAAGCSSPVHELTRRMQHACAAGGALPADVDMQCYRELSRAAVEAWPVVGNANTGEDHARLVRAKWARRRWRQHELEGGEGGCGGVRAGVLQDRLA